jgi:hypothetical protein
MQNAGCSEIRIPGGPARGAAWTNNKQKRLYTYSKQVMKTREGRSFFGTFRWHLANCYDTNAMRFQFLPFRGSRFMVRSLSIT